MKRSSLWLLAGGAVAAIALWAQSTTTTQPTIADLVAQRVAHLTTLLDLTASQQASATMIFTTEQTALAALDTSEQTARTAIKTAITSDNIAGITAAADTIGSLATQQAQAEGTGEAAFYLLLTSTQQAKYDVLGDNGGPGAPGGQDGPHGPPGRPGPGGATGASGASGKSH